MAEVHRRCGASFDIFTTAPRWFFEESLGGSFRYHPVEVDVGFRQKSALEFDRDATVAALQALVPFDAAVVERLGVAVREAGASVVLCDIASMGVAVAEAAGLPSVLVENFAWSWLYEPLVGEVPELEALGSELDRWVDRATVHVQARPVCDRRGELELVDPISREPTLERSAARRTLDVGEADRVVVVTMGGYGEALPFLDRLYGRDDVTFLVTGAEVTGRRGNVHLFDNNTPLFMPNVLRAADAVVAKLGYGMVSEVWREGVPLAGVTRPDFREMGPLEAFARDELSGFVLAKDDYATGDWIDRLSDLFAAPRVARGPGGAPRVADVLLEVAAAPSG